MTLYILSKYIYDVKMPKWNKVGSHLSKKVVLCASMRGLQKWWKMLFISS